MQKLTVYLAQEEADGLRRLSHATGRSQSELIREGIRQVVRGAPRRVFHSMGTGRSGATEVREEPARAWNADGLHARSFRRADGAPLRVDEQKAVPAADL
jgi:hypothetical protein